MKQYDIERKPVNDSDFLGQIPKHAAYTKLVSEESIFYEGGKPAIVYKIIPRERLESFRRAALASNFIKNLRSRGLPTKSAIYGALPRIVFRHNYCRYTSNTRNQSEYNETVFEFTRYIDELYAEYLPEEHRHNAELVRGSVHPEWLIEDTPFASVNFNVNHAIKYHRDSGNFKGVYSNVLILKDGMVGGFLVCPEFDMAFAQQDGALILFDGQKIIHGVTPIKATKDNGYRCSCVFYALESMKHCYPYKQEMEQAKRHRDKIESRFRPQSDRFQLTGSSLPKPPAPSTK
jgi:Oxygenase domain of the 2OGFeDO superfamily